MILEKRRFAMNDAMTQQVDAALAVRKQAEGVLISRAWRDPAFKKQLLADPRNTVEKAMGLTLPPGMTITVLEEGPTAMVLSLPAPPAADGELTDLALEQVTGGASKGDPVQRQPQR
jgi:hypothetical protein